MASFESNLRLMARDDRIFEKALRALAASSSRWVYDPKMGTQDPETIAQDKEAIERLRARYGDDYFYHSMLLDALEYLPCFFYIDEYPSPVIVSIKYKHRTLILPTECEQAQKATFVAELSWNCTDGTTMTKRIFVLTFRGSVTMADWVANAAVTLDKGTFKHINGGMNVHTGFSSLVGDGEREAAFLKALQEESSSSSSSLDCVLITGHSLGGALAQVAALVAWQYGKDSTDDALRILIMNKLRCITFAAPQPFAPSAEPTEDQRCALKWLLKSCLNYVHNNDVVPRLPGNLGYLEDVVKDAPEVSITVAPIKYAVGKTKLKDLVSKLRTNASMAFIKRYRPTSMSIFLGHKCEDQGDGPYEPHVAIQRLNTRVEPDPDLKIGGFKDWYTGGLLSIGEEHKMDVYADRVFMSVGVNDVDSCFRELRKRVWGGFVTSPLLTALMMRRGAGMHGDCLSKGDFSPISPGDQKVPKPGHEHA